MKIKQKKKVLIFQPIGGVENINAICHQLLEADATEHEQLTDVGEGIIVATVKDP